MFLGIFDRLEYFVTTSTDNFSQQLNTVGIPAVHKVYMQRATRLVKCEIVQRFGGLISLTFGSKFLGESSPCYFDPCAYVFDTFHSSFVRWQDCTLLIPRGTIECTILATSYGAMKPGRPQVCTVYGLPDQYCAESEHMVGWAQNCKWKPNFFFVFFCLFCPFYMNEISFWQQSQGKWNFIFLPTRTSQIWSNKMKMCTKYTSVLLCSFNLLNGKYIYHSPSASQLSIREV